MVITGWWGLAGVLIVNSAWLIGLYLRLRFQARAQDTKVGAWMGLAKQRPDLRMIEETSSEGVTTRITMNELHLRELEDEHT